MQATLDSAPVFTDPEDIFDKAVLLVIKFGYGMGLKRRVQNENVQTEAEEGWVEGYKKILQSPEFEAIKSADGKLRTYITSRCLESLDEMFKSGIYPLPNDLVAEVDEQVELHRENRAVLVDKFLATYDSRVKEAKDNLNDLFSESDYPRAADLKRSLRIDTKYICINTPDSLKSISQNLFKRESDKAKAMWKEAKEEMALGMRLQAQGLLEHMVDRLTPNEDGKSKIFRRSMLDKLNDYLKTFEARNIVNDAKLAEAIDEIKQITAGVDVETLRNKGDIRTQVAEKLAVVKAELDTMVVEKPSRMFVPDDE